MRIPKRRTPTHPGEMLRARFLEPMNVSQTELARASHYRRGWSHEEAVAQIRQESGRHFDPTVVEAFLAMIEESPP